MAADDVHTYRVISGKVRVPGSPDESDVTIPSPSIYRPGDTVDLSERQAEPHVEAGSLERVDGDSGGGSESDGEAGDGGDPADGSGDGSGDDSGDDSPDESRDGSGDEIPDPLTEEWIDGAEYRELQQAAKRFDDVNGTWGAERLKTELRHRINEGEETGEGEG